MRCDLSVCDRLRPVPSGAVPERRWGKGRRWEDNLSVAPVINFLATGHLTIGAGCFLTPFNIFNERLTLIWIHKFIDAPMHDIPNDKDVEIPLTPNDLGDFYRARGHFSGTDPAPMIVEINVVPRSFIRSFTPVLVFP